MKTSWRRVKFKETQWYPFSLPLDACFTNLDSDPNGREPFQRANPTPNWRVRCDAIKLDGAWSSRVRLVPARTDKPGVKFPRARSRTVRSFTIVICLWARPSRERERERESGAGHWPKQMQRHRRRWRRIYGRVSADDECRHHFQKTPCPPPAHPLLPPEAHSSTPAVTFNGYGSAQLIFYFRVGLPTCFLSLPLSFSQPNLT